MSTQAGRAAMAARAAEREAELQAQIARARVRIAARPELRLRIIDRVGVTALGNADGLTEIAATSGGITTIYKLPASLAWHIGAQLCGLEPVVFP